MSRGFQLPESLVAPHALPDLGLEGLEHVGVLRLQRLQFALCASTASNQIKRHTQPRSIAREAERVRALNTLSAAQGRPSPPA
jgi:hypothetical protein